MEVFIISYQLLLLIIIVSLFIIMKSCLLIMYYVYVISSCHTSCNLYTQSVKKTLTIVSLKTTYFSITNRM